MSNITSRERLARALRHQAADYIPCSFMSFTALRRRCQENMYELVKAERAMGLDSFLFIPTLSRPQRPEHPELRGLPVRFDSAVETRERREDVPGQHAVLHKEYSTPAGKLQTSVRLSDDWPHGDHIPFIDDFQVPRAIKPLLTGEAGELEALQYLLTPPQSDDVAQFKAEAERAHAFAREQGVLLAGGWGVGVDMKNRSPCSVVRCVQPGTQTCGTCADNDNVEIFLHTLLAGWIDNAATSPLKIKAKKNTLIAIEGKGGGMN